MINSNHLAKRKLSIYFGVFILTILVIPAYADETVKPTDRGTINVGFSTDPANPTTGDQTQLKISFLNKQTNVIQQHIDYKVSVMQDENQVFGIPISHTAEGAVAVPFQFQNNGTYQVIVDVEGILFQPIPPEKASFTVNVGTGIPEFPLSAAIVFVVAVISIITISARSRLKMPSSI
jgi:predicted secreted protein with PEFG-CTERM motif